MSNVLLDAAGRRRSPATMPGFHGHDLTQKRKTFVELPTPVNPLYGEGQDPCVWIAPQMLVATTFGEEVTCTAELGTVVNTGAMHFCSPFEKDYFADTP